MCKFYPVSHGASVEANPEEAKVDAMKEFVSYVKQLSEEFKSKS